MDRTFGNVKKHMGSAARRVPTREVPHWIVRFAALFVPDLKTITPEFGNSKSASNEKAKRALGWAPRSNEEAVVATG